MSANRIFKREAKRQIKEGMKLKRAGEKGIRVPFIVKPDASKHVRVRSGE